jgi:hypothetical protein
LRHLSKEAIADHPVDYANHVSAHYYAMWLYAFAAPIKLLQGDFLLGANNRAESLLSAYAPSFSADFKGYLSLLGPLPPFKTIEQRTLVVSRIDESTVKKLFDLLTLRDLAEIVSRNLLERNAVIMLGFGLLSGLLVFRLPAWSTAARAFCYSGLCLNAYFLGTALAQPALPRYAWTMQGVEAAFLLIGLYLTGRTFVSRLHVFRGQRQFEAGRSRF